MALTKRTVRGLANLLNSNNDNGDLGASSILRPENCADELKRESETSSYSQLGHDVFSSRKAAVFRGNSSSVFDVPGVYSEAISRKLKEKTKAIFQETPAVVDVDGETVDTFLATSPSRSSGTTADVSCARKQKASRCNGAIKPFLLDSEYACTEESTEITFKNRADKRQLIRKHAAKRKREKEAQDFDTQPRSLPAAPRYRLRKSSRSSRNVILINSDSDCEKDCNDATVTASGGITVLDSSLDLSINALEEEYVESEVYRIVVIQPLTNMTNRSKEGNFNSILVTLRLKRTDSMQKVFEAAFNAANCCNGILFLLNNSSNSSDTRREVFQEDTVESLSLSKTGVTQMEFLPLSMDVSANAFIIKFITGKLRETVEISCRPSDPFSLIFEKFCNAWSEKKLNLPTSEGCAYKPARKELLFKFDDEVIRDVDTPESLDMDSGDLVEAYFESLPNSIRNSNTKKGKRRVSRRSYTGRAA